MLFNFFGMPSDTSEHNWRKLILTASHNSSVEKNQCSFQFQQNICPNSFHGHNETKIFGPRPNINMHIITEPLIDYAGWMHRMMIMNEAEILHGPCVEHFSQQLQILSSVHPAIKTMDLCFLFSGWKPSPCWDQLWNNFAFYFIVQKDFPIVIKT